MRLFSFSAAYNVHGEPLVIQGEGETIYRWSKKVLGKLGDQTKIPHVDPTLMGDLVRSLAAFAGR